MNNTALYIITVAVWGSTWLAIEYQLGVVAPEVSVFYRYVLASALLFAWAALKKLPLRFAFRDHLRFAMLGVLLFGLNYILAYHAQRYVASALIAIAFSMIVWMNMLNARLFFGSRSGPAALFGALLGIVGLLMMFWPSVAAISLSDSTVIGALLGMAGAYSASLGNMVSQNAQRRKLPIIQANAWGMAYGALFTGLVVIALGRPLAFDRSAAYLLSLFYLAVFGSIVGFGAYLQLLGRIGAEKAGYATVLFPIVALVLSVIFEGLELSGLMIGGMLLALLGNLFVMQPSRGSSLPKSNASATKSTA